MAVEVLHEIAQITDGEHDSLQIRIYNKMMKINRNPKPPPSSPSQVT